MPPRKYVTARQYVVTKDKDGKAVVLPPRIAAARHRPVGQSQPEGVREGEGLMVTASGVVVGRDRAAFQREIREWYGRFTADALVRATLPPDEQLRLDWYREHGDFAKED
jgi:hypothetical protein